MADDLFVYFDGVSAIGQRNGAIQLELVASTLEPTEDGGVEVRHVTTAHLRCSPTAAVDLAQAIEKALKMISEAAKQSSAGGSVN